MQPFLIVGLGNPGKQYEHTPHNVGFLAVDAFAQTHIFPEWHLEKKANALITKQDLLGNTVVLAKSQMFMNNSGVSVKSLYTKYNPPAGGTNLIVVHDDIDLSLGRMKISQNSGSAGHKGVASIAQHLETQDFVRLRIGIAPATGKPAQTERFVLKKFNPQDFLIAQHCIAHSLHVLKLLVRHNPQQAMNQYN
jgi:peptidyl-tRNA hydrolase, PTH1 family